MSTKEKKSSIKKKRWRIGQKKNGNQPDALPKEIYDLKDLIESKEINLKPRVNAIKTSKLSPSLLDILKKSVALGYFLEFLKGQDRKNLLDFWLEAETFRMISESKYNRRRSRTASILSSSHDRCPSASSNVDDMPNSEICVCGKTNFSVISTNSSTCCKCSDYSPTLCKSLKSGECDLLHPTNHDWQTQQNQSTTKEHLSEGIPEDKRKASTFPKVTKPTATLEEFRKRARTRSSIIDAVTIYSRFISLNAENPIRLPSSLRQQIEGSICKDKNSIDADCFVNAQEYIFEKLLALHYEFLMTNNMISYQINFLEEKQMKLEDVLYNESISFYFMEFLDQKGSKDILEFYMTAENFEADIDIQLQTGNYSADNAVSDAMYMYEKYFSMKCPQQLIADDKLRIVLENNICRDDGPQPNCFCIPMAYAWTALVEVYLPSFLTSDIFKCYVDRLKKSLQGIDDVRSCSSRSSLSLDDNYPMLVQSESKLNLFDEKGIDEFWFKPSHHQQTTNRLALGYVNEFGVFNSEMEPEPSGGSDRDSSVSKLSKAMKNFLRGETVEETEHLAWERARKIVNDIQKQTQH